MEFVTWWVSEWREFVCPANPYLVCNKMSTPEAKWNHLIYELPEMHFSHVFIERPGAIIKEPSG